MTYQSLYTQFTIDNTTVINLAHIFTMGMLQRIELPQTVLSHPINGNHCGACAMQGESIPSHKCPI